MLRVPSEARVVIIGGGIVGCSVAYHLSQLGWTDCVLLERAKLTSGTTFHAAGLVGQLRSSRAVTQIIQRSVRLYSEFEKDPDLSSGWRQTGCLRLASTAERMAELQSQVSMARSLDIAADMVSAAEALTLCPILSADRLIGASFVPSDGQLSPSDITQALAKVARRNGVRIVEDCPVLDLERDWDRIKAVVTADGRISCDFVVLCAGQWSRDLAALAQVNVPLISIENQYVITERMPGVTRSTPTVRDPDGLFYFREEVGGLSFGGYPKKAIPWALNGIPRDFTFSLLDFNWDDFETIMDGALARIPALAEVGIKETINGPESATPDSSFILGEAPGCAGMFVAAGFNGFGIAAAGGAGGVLAEWIVSGLPQQDVAPVDIRRFGSETRDIDWVRAKALKRYSQRYSATT